MDAVKLLEEQQRLLFRSKSYKDNYTDNIKVGLYGRVSTEHEQQLSAFSNQLDWYELILRQHPTWEVYDIYSDKASGTNTKRRKDFNRMIDDALNGKFQLLITREVCRFARNTVDSLNYVRLLKAKGIEVFFVNDGIWSQDTDGELRLTIFSALAQDEARKTSERCRAGQLVSREKGILYGYNAFGYKHIKGETSVETRYIADIDESETVRMIYDLYLSGLGLKAIAAQLIAAGRKSKNGIVKWDCTKVSRILSNKLYCGYVVYGRSAKEDFLSKRVTNTDTNSYIYIKSDKVEPIITEDDFERVQAIKSSRKKKTSGRGQGKVEAKDRYTRKLVCGHCGKTFKKFKWHKNKDGTVVMGYQCRNIVDNHSAKLRTDNGQSGEGFCNLPSIAEWKLDFMITSIVNDIWDTPSATVEKLKFLVSEAITDTSEHEKYVKRIGTLQTEIAKAESRKQTLEMKWLDGKISDEDHDRLCGVINGNINSYKTEVGSLQELLDARPDYSEVALKMENIRMIESLLISNENLTTLRVDDEFIDAIVARIVPYEGRRFKFYLNIGSGKGWSFFSEEGYELYDKWTLGFDAARRYRKAHNQYLRKNQWEDLHVEVYIRTK
jgi:DNA invertase Pin-like site-specific DNA recombinase